MSGDSPGVAGTAPPRRPERIDLRTALAPLAWPRFRALALAIFVTYAYFVARPAWNQNSRFALTRALVEERSPIIDRDHATTGDKSFRDGHFYCDKAPGLSILAVPVYAVFYGLRRLGGGELPAVEVIPLDPVDLAAERAPPPDRMGPGDRLRYNPAWRIATYLCRVGTVVPLALLGLAGLFALAHALARQRGHEAPRARSLATWVTLTYALATPAFPYATGLYGHRPVADLLIAAFAFITLTPPPDPSLGIRGPSTRELVGLGALLGAAVCIEYPAAPPVAALFGLAWARFGAKAGLRLVVAGAPFALGLALYHAWAFGGPLRTGYDFVYLETFAEGMKVQYGIHRPDPGAAFEILFGSYRGLFALAPVLIPALWGLTQVDRRIAGTAVAVFAYYLALNAGYYMWDGGAAIGPRHLLPALPFLALGLVPFFAAFPRAAALLALVSGLQMLLATYAGPEAPTHGHPLWGWAIFEFTDFGRVGSSSATNLGRFLGLPGPTSLVPLALAWLALIPRKRELELTDAPLGGSVPPARGSAKITADKR